MNMASNTRLRLTTQVGQAHAATRVLLDLGTNSRPHRSENTGEHKTQASLTYTGQAVSTWRLPQKSSTLVKPVQHTGQTSPSQKAPKHQTGLPSSKLTQTRNSSNTGQWRTHLNIHLSKTQ
jgi:hypothetical protein